MKLLLPKDWIFAHHRLAEAFTDAKMWLITSLIAPIIMFIEKYIFSDWNFIVYILIAMIFDILTALIKVYIKEGGNHITSKGLRQSVVKAIQYFVFLITIHWITNIHVQGERIEIYDWIIPVAYTFLMVIEIRSIWENLTGMGNGFDLSEFIKKISNKELWSKESNRSKNNSEDGAS